MFLVGSLKLESLTIIKEFALMDGSSYSSVEISWWAIQAKHVPKALRFFGGEILGNNYITLLFVYSCEDRNASMMELLKLGGRHLGYSSKRLYFPVKDFIVRLQKFLRAQNIFPRPVDFPDRNSSIVRK
jgi:hypothetical protein